MADAASVILVIEDHAATREALAAILRRQGYDAMTAKDGGAALQMLASGAKPDLILLDMLMPFVDGWRFLDRFRPGVYRSVPIIVMTGSNLTDEWADDHDCAGFLQKPIDEADLLAVVRNALKRE